MATNAHADTESNDIKPLSVQDAVTLLTNEVGTTLYFLHVPDQRRRGRDKSKSGLHAYREVSLALRQRGAILATAHVSFAMLRRRGKREAKSHVTTSLCMCFQIGAQACVDEISVGEDDIHDAPSR